MSLMRPVSNDCIKCFFVFLFLLLPEVAPAQPTITLSPLDNINVRMFKERAVARGRVSCPEPHVGFKLWFNNYSSLGIGGDKGIAYEMNVAKSFNVSLHFNTDQNKVVSARDVIVTSSNENIFFEVFADDGAAVYPGVYRLQVSAECVY